MRSCAHVRFLVLAVLLFAPVKASAEWQLKPFIGFTFGGDTTLLLGAEGASHPGIVFGVGSLWLGEVIGFEADIAHVPGFFEPNPFVKVVQSGVTTFTGNIVVAMPRRLTRYTLRPYVVGGGGLMRAHLEGPIEGALPVQSSLAAIDVGGGVTGFLSDRIGLNWDVRRFVSVGGKVRGQSIGAEQVSFWRASTAVVIRF